MTGPARLLVVEDDFLSQRMAVAMLQGAGYQVDTHDVPGAVYDAVVRGVTKPVDRIELLVTVAALLAPAVEVLDLVIVEQLRVLGRDVDDVGFFAELVEQFVGDAGDRLVGLRAAAGSGDFDTVGRIAHALKGAGAQLGGARLAEACAAMQTAADAGVPEAALAAVGVVEDEYEFLRAALTDEVARGG